MDVPCFTQSFPEKWACILFPGFYLFATANHSVINIFCYWGHFFSCRVDSQEWESVALKTIYGILYSYLTEQVSRSRCRTVCVVRACFWIEYLWKNTPEMGVLTGGELGHNG